MRGGREIVKRDVGWRVAVAFLAGALVGAFSAVEVLPNFTGDADVVAAGPGPETPEDQDPRIFVQQPGDGGPEGGPIAVSTDGHLNGVAKLECAAGRNGGKTDQGVTGDEIRMATTVVESGIGAAFLRDVRFAMQAIAEDVNRRGGICGRKLVIRYVDDAWDAQRGATYLRNFIAEKVFAIPVGPSSEGLRVVISGGDIDRARIPVVGTDGMLIDQYVYPNAEAQPWVWPVAVATVGAARIMARDAFNRLGARRFGIVFDRNYRFGREGALAFNAEVKRLTGKNIEGFNSEFRCEKAFCGIQAGMQSYSNEVREFYGTQSDFTALFLEPQTGLTWMSDPNAVDARQWKYGAAQPLFTRDFAEQCRLKCDQMMVWSGFKPPIESYKVDPTVRAYVDALHSSSPQADEFNAFVIGGYVGMQLLVKALEAVGPYLTRQRLKEALDRTRLDTGLTMTGTLGWRPDWRYVNSRMQGFVIEYKATFAGWREGPIVKDPCPDCGTE